LGEHLPESFPAAAKIIVKSMGKKAESPTEQAEGQNEGGGMAPFLFMPHAMFVASHGLDHFEESMAAQYEITQRFTAEFSIRALSVRVVGAIAGVGGRRQSPCPSIGVGRHTAAAAVGWPSA
jgi:hypothetical protein